MTGESTGKHWGSLKVKLMRPRNSLTSVLGKSLTLNSQELPGIRMKIIAIPSKSLTLLVNTVVKSS